MINTKKQITSNLTHNNAITNVQGEIMTEEFRNQLLSGKTKQYRMDNNLSVAELCKLTGVSKSTIYSLENKNSAPNLLTIMKLVLSLDTELKNSFFSN